MSFLLGNMKFRTSKPTNSQKAMCIHTKKKAFIIHFVTELNINEAIIDSQQPKLTNCFILHRLLFPE
jgi:hypothetical protein